MQLPGIMQINKGIGMQLLNDELEKLIQTGKVDMDEAMAKAVDKDDLHRRFRTGLTLGQASLADETFRVVRVVPELAGGPGRASSAATTSSSWTASPRRSSPSTRSASPSASTASAW